MAARGFCFCVRPQTSFCESENTTYKSLCPIQRDSEDVLNDLDDLATFVEVKVMQDNLNVSMSFNLDAVCNVHSPCMDRTVPLLDQSAILPHSPLPSPVPDTDILESSDSSDTELTDLDITIPIQDESMELQEMSPRRTQDTGFPESMPAADTGPSVPHASRDSGFTPNRDITKSHNCCSGDGDAVTPEKVESSPPRLSPSQKRLLAKRIQKIRRELQSNRGCRTTQLQMLAIL